ncbi:MAG TPA: hypothetical protein VJV79_23265, partial [Polyangiaceae bacterium]|nr:hypothetical protein [Polyangiaceae bacterium]
VRTGANQSAGLGGAQHDPESVLTRKPGESFDWMVAHAHHFLSAATVAQMETAMVMPASTGSAAREISAAFTRAAHHAHHLRVAGIARAKIVSLQTSVILELYA